MNSKDIKAVLITNIKIKDRKHKLTGDEPIDALVELASSVGLEVTIEVIELNFDMDGRG
jgi:hypothetical protein